MIYSENVLNGGANANEVERLRRDQMGIRKRSSRRSYGSTTDKPYEGGFSGYHESQISPQVSHSAPYGHVHSIRRRRGM